MFAVLLSCVVLCSCFYHQLAAEIWSTSHDGVSDFCSSCTLLTQAVAESWNATAIAHRKTFFPNYILKHSVETIQAVNVSLTQVSDGQDTLRGELFKVAVLNMSYLGTEGVKMRGEMKTVLSTLVSMDEVKTCALVVAPVTGEWGLQQRTRAVLKKLAETYWTTCGTTRA